MRRIGPLALVLALATPARAVDITGTWSVCLGNGGAFCPTTITGVLVSSGGQFTVTFQDAGIPCFVQGSVDTMTGALAVGDTSGCATFFGGMSATATDTSITGTFSFLLCPAYTLTGVAVCGACDDGNACTVDGCGATLCSAPASPCTPVPLDGTTCSDGLACTTGDVCVSGACQSTPVGCGDGNPCTDDMCDPAIGACVFTPNTAPCNDGNVCTTGDTCSGGACVGGPALECAPCERCGPFVGCVVGPAPGCRHSVTPAKSKLLLRTTPGGTQDRLAWTWGTGAATTAAEFGDPVATDDYTLCVFDTVTAPSRLVLQSSAPHGGTCKGGTSCWTARGNLATKGLVYKDRGLLLPDGIRMVKLSPGARARAKVKGLGPELELPVPLDVALPLTVQLQRPGGVCFESVYTEAKVSREDLFRATAAQ